MFNSVKKLWYREAQKSGWSDQKNDDWKKCTNHK